MKNKAPLAVIALFWFFMGALAMLAAYPLVLILMDGPL